MAAADAPARGAEWGDLAPIRQVLARVGEMERQDRARRPADDPGVLALREVGAMLSRALEEAAAPRALSPADLATQEGITRSGVYKRFRRGRLEGATKSGGRIRIPART
jgi:hypothetical protein